MKSLAPIVLFAHTRPLHLKRTLESLSDNYLAEYSDLFICVDAAKNEGEKAKVNDVLGIARSQSKFQSVSIIQREVNFGLAGNIIDGVSAICEKHGRAIVLEDDMVTSPHFLQFMNEALVRYENSENVWHISGWNYPINDDGLGDAFFWRVMNCWGWATWADRWEHFDKDAEKLLNTWGEKNIKQFNLEGANNYWGDIKRNANGSINTWAVFWYATIFEKGGLCLNPSRSLVRNIGLDGSGENCNKYDPYKMDVAMRSVVKFPVTIAESTIAVDKIKKYFSDEKPSFIKRMARFVNRFTASG